jgi:hypothetical protein
LEIASATRRHEAISTGTTHNRICYNDFTNVIPTAVMLFAEDSQMRLICSIAVMICLSGVAAEKEPEKLPAILRSKDATAFQDHFKMIMNQIKSVDKPTITKESMKTLDAAFAAVVQEKPQHKFNCCMEYEGWFLFSNMGLLKDFKIEDAQNLNIIFHNGFAVRKGDDKVYSFGFW